MQQKKGIILILFACLSFCLQIRGQSTDLLIQEFITAWLQGSVSSGLSGQILKGDDNEVLSLLQKYQSDKNDRAREAAWYLTAAVGRRTVVPYIRKQVLMLLLQGSRDSDPLVARKNLAQLKNFDRSLFDAQAKKVLEDIFRTTANPSEELIKITGFAGCVGLIPDFKARIREIREKEAERKWAYYLALARMGDGEAIRYCMKRIQQLPVNDETIEDVFPDLIYIRRKEAVDYLLEVALDRPSGCSSSNPDNEQAVSCTAKILEMIAPYLAGFPVQDTAAFSSLSSEETIALVRKWLKEKYNTDAILQDLY